MDAQGAGLEPAHFRARPLDSVIDLSSLQQRIGYQFKDASLARQALTHRSARAEHNERLEFLGDALLGFLMAEEAWNAWPDASEGDLTIMRAAVINRTVLSEVAVALDLGSLLELGAGEAKSGGRQRESVLSTAMEALIAAIYLDGGLDACREFVKTWFPAPGENFGEGGVRKDNKSRLQELMQSQRRALPGYEVLEIGGSGHEQQFRVKCTLAELEIATEGSGASRRAAEQMAAGMALAALEPQA
ncbi:MAG: ribonuclease III [Gammaproteobacteria bacterium]|nr:ribonuclease III [Gammaproteobacteria bacterium]MYI01194.1 ribonuclease III [Gammaproteobacteria bacterium]